MKVGRDRPSVAEPEGATQEFDIESLACEGAKTSTCLSERELNAAKIIYDDLYINGERAFPGYPVGGELSPGGWAKWLTGGTAVVDVGEFQAGNLRARWTSPGQGVLIADHIRRADAASCG